MQIGSIEGCITYKNSGVGDWTQMLKTIKSYPHQPDQDNSITLYKIYKIQQWHIKKKVVNIM